MKNFTVIEFSSIILRSIELTVQFIMFQMRLIKENERYILTDLVTHKRKEKIQRKSIEIEEIQHTAQYCADIQNPTVITSFFHDL